MRKISSNFKPGDIIVITLPFSNLTGSKNRPALVISSEEFNGRGNDIIVLKITGSYFHTPWEIPLVNKDLTRGKLKKEGYIDAGFIFTVEKSLVFKKIAEIRPELLARVKKALVEIFAI